MDFEPTSAEELTAIVAANRIARRDALLRTAAGHPKWRQNLLALFGAGMLIYIAFALTSTPWGLVGMLLLIFTQALDSATSRRLDAILQLLEEEKG
jgi:hypothetical protein